MIIDNRYILTRIFIWVNLSIFFSFGCIILIENKNNNSFFILLIPMIFCFIELLMLLGEIYYYKFRVFGRYFEYHDFFRYWKYSKKIIKIRKLITILKIISLSIFCSSSPFLNQLNKTTILYCFLFYTSIYCIFNLTIGLIFSLDTYYFIFYINCENISQGITRNVSAPLDICSICYDNEKIEWCKLDCNHLFHFECVDLWVKRNKSCPLCRKNT